jgi:hypothetical protein
LIVVSKGSNWWKLGATGALGVANRSSGTSPPAGHAPKLTVALASGPELG